MNIRLVALALLCLLSGAARADESMPLLYSRTHIMVIRKNPPSLPWQAGEKASPGLMLDVEVRDAASYYNQRGWFSLNAPADNAGVMLAFTAPGISPVVPQQQYSPLDVLMIDPQGKIIQILPSIVLSDLKSDIYPDHPVLAILFMKGGACAGQSIAPGDEIDYKIFTKPPTVLTAPAAAPVAAPAASATPVPQVEPTKIAPPTVRRTPAHMLAPISVPGKAPAKSSTPSATR